MTADVVQVLDFLGYVYLIGVPITFVGLLLGVVISCWGSLGGFTGGDVAVFLVVALIAAVFWPGAVVYATVRAYTNRLL